MKLPVFKYCFAIGFTFFQGLVFAAQAIDDFVIHAKMNDQTAIIKALNSGHNPNLIDSKGHLRSSQQFQRAHGMWLIY